MQPRSPPNHKARDSHSLPAARSGFNQPTNPSGTIVRCPGECEPENRAALPIVSAGNIVAVHVFCDRV